MESNSTIMEDLRRAIGEEGKAHIIARLCTMRTNAIRVHCDAIQVYGVPSQQEAYRDGYETAVADCIAAILADEQD